MPLPEDFLFIWGTQRCELSRLFETPSAVGCPDLCGVSSVVGSPVSLEHPALWAVPISVGYLVLWALPVVIHGVTSTVASPECV